MNFLDIVLAVIVAYFLVRGIFRGMIKELTSIVGVLGGFYFAFSYYPPLAMYLKRWIDGPGYATLLSVLILFVGVYLVISILGVIVKYLLSIADLGWTDRTLGGIFGIIKGALIVIVLIGMLTAFLAPKSALLTRSTFVRHLSGFSALLLRVGPDEVEKRFDIHLKELQKNWHATRH